jgi:hypothetical protein
MQNAATGLCLDDSNQGLRTFPCNPASINNGFQAWREIINPSVPAFQNVATGRCLDDSNHGLRTFPCNSASYINQFQVLFNWADDLALDRELFYQ